MRSIAVGHARRSWQREGRFPDVLSFFNQFATAPDVFTTSAIFLISLRR
ncbi:MAG: hypothetical protein JWQ00_2010 [Noviherbaspirillum sp.]|nr:hypothetical protein [Noviherbaspirillum sp.]